MRDIAFSRDLMSTIWLDHTASKRREDFGFGRDAQARGGTNFVSQTVVPEEWKENFRISRPSLLKLSEELRPYMEGKSTRMMQPVDVGKESGMQKD